MNKTRKSHLCAALLLTSLVTLSGCQEASGTNTNSITSTAPVKTETVATSEAVATPEVSQEVTEDQSIQDIRTVSSNENCYSAVSYLGFTDKSTPQEILDELSGNYETTDFSFIENISSDNVVMAGGGDIYCIVPADMDATVKVERLDLDESGASVTGDVLYEGGSEPILLICNESDIMPNSLVTIKTGEQQSAFSPHISLKDGTVAFQTEEKDIYVFGKDVTGGKYIEE